MINFLQAADVVVEQPQQPANYSLFIMIGLMILVLWLFMWRPESVRNWWLKVNNFDYDATLPELCHQFLKEGDKMAPSRLGRIFHFNSPWNFRSVTERSM